MSSPLVGFCGSRSLPSCWASQVGQVVQGVQALGQRVAVGCARGADQLARQAAHHPLVFQASAFGSGRGAFAARSSAMVRVVSGSGPGSALAGFVLAPCPPGIAPARSWRSGRPPSGSWSALALAVGLGVPVTVWCGSSLCGSAFLPAWGGSWRIVALGPFAGGWRFVPAQWQLL